MTQVVVVIGGGRLTPPAVEQVDPQAVVYAADSGLDVAREAGLRPTVLVGDLDSISAAGRMWAYAHELCVHEYPADKGSTDTVLAIGLAARPPSVTDLLVLGGAGDRLDHTIGTLAALADAGLARLDSVRAVLGTTTIHTLHPGRTVTLDVPAATTFSLFALFGPCTGVTVAGARWPLHYAELPPGTTLGVSNETASEPGVATTISVAGGTLTAVIP